MCVFCGGVCLKKNYMFRWQKVIAKKIHLSMVERQQKFTIKCTTKCLKVVLLLVCSVLGWNAICPGLRVRSALLYSLPLETCFTELLPWREWGLIIKSLRVVFRLIHNSQNELVNNRNMLLPQDYKKPVFWIIAVPLPDVFYEIAINAWLIHNSQN